MGGGIGILQAGLWGLVGLGFADKSQRPLQAQSSPAAWATCCSCCSGGCTRFGEDLMVSKRRALGYTLIDGRK